MLTMGVATLKGAKVVAVRTCLEVDEYARKVPPVSFRPRTDMQMDGMSDIVFLYDVLLDLCLIYAYLVEEHLFSCLTPFSEMFKLRGYMLVEISAMVWIDTVT